ncbi:hypothetical protein ACJX0J_022103, partial [Zea mays]
MVDWEKWTDNIIPDIIVAYDDYCGLQAQILTLQKTTTNNVGTDITWKDRNIIYQTIKGLEVHFYKHNKQFTDKHTLVNVIFVILTRTETKIIPSVLTKYQHYIRLIWVRGA